MATSPVKLLGTARFSSGTHTAGQKFYFRSSSGSDGNVAAVAYGEATSGGDAERFTVTPAASSADIESLSTNAWDTLRYFEYGASPTGSIQVRSNDGTAAVGTIHIHIQPSDTDTLIIGLSGGKTQTFTWKTTLTPTAGEVKIGVDVSESADNLASIINDSSTGTSSPAEGTDYQATAADPYVSATVSGSYVTITDRIKCARQRTWVLTPSDTDDVVGAAPSGGVDGTLLGTVAAAAATPGSISTTEGLVFDDETLATKYFPPGITGAFTKVNTRGPFALSIRLGTDPAAAVASKIQTSTDGVNGWQDVTTTITDLDTDQEQHITGADLFGEYARWNITANSSAVAAEANIKFEYGR